MMTAARQDGLVYCTSQGRFCGDCGKPKAKCICKQKKSSVPKGDGVVRIMRETKGRKGKGVTLINGIPLAGDELKKLATELKQKCGSGGTLKDGVIEIQGDHRDKLLEVLQSKGWTVKKAGG